MLHDFIVRLLVLVSHIGGPHLALSMIVISCCTASVLPSLHAVARPGRYNRGEQANAVKCSRVSHRANVSVEVLPFGSRPMSTSRTRSGSRRDSDYGGMADVRRNPFRLLDALLTAHLRSFLGDTIREKYFPGG